MQLVVTPTQEQIQEALVAFLQSVLPSAVEVIEGQDNRVPEPEVTEYVLFTTVNRPRLSTNVDDYTDTFFTASITGTVMTVSDVDEGDILDGATVFGVGVAANTKVVFPQVSGTPGGAGVYNVSVSQTVSSETMASGQLTATQNTEIVVQLDCHSATVTGSADYAQTISTMLRDDYAVQNFAESGFAVFPLYADDPKQMPFINDQNQWETRWIVMAHLQANQTISGISQQFAAALKVQTISVDAAYPPS
jgi:hypothetical protein